ncbi:hypothetical protein BKE38_17800 [Pseudoroseomonas deserti]|uniref:Acyl-CoA dehydrogenase n=1 Tax=Teichococcus deserti TaxID=1817963 RepID=A0A1V2GZW2_9PROT|nr:MULTISPECIES: hypothetical protein [Acetobacteraceae]ONG50571.1 hypothetical protein BKE38_17800 [Pseudoroseomonas deserti]
MSSSRALPWNDFSEQQQLAFSQEALRRAALTLAGHAELLAREMEGGALLDQGGPEALRLFAQVMRATTADAFGTPCQA